MYSAHINSNLTRSEEIRFKTKYKHFMTHMSKVLHLSYSEIERLMIIYHEGTRLRFRNKETMSLMTLRYILHTGLDMTDDKFLDSIVSVVAGRNQRFPMVRWLVMMNLFLKGSLEEKIDYVFKVYTGKCCTKTLKKVHVFLLLQECMEDDEEMIREFSDMIMKMMDVNRIGKLTFDNFRDSVLEQPYLLEVLGPVLPTKDAIHAFLKTFTWNKKNYGKPSLILARPKPFGKFVREKVYITKSVLSIY